MSSGVPVPSLGHLFPKLEYWRPFEALTKKCENTKNISKISLHGWRAWQNWFLDTKNFLVPVIFLSFFTYHRSEKCPEPKRLLTKNISFFMPVNHVKKYLISIHTCLVFLPFLARALYAPSIPILERNVPNLVQGLLRTCYLLIWVWQLDFQETKLH